MRPAIIFYCFSDCTRNALVSCWPSFFPVTGNRDSLNVCRHQCLEETTKNASLQESVPLKVVLPHFIGNVRIFNLLISYFKSIHCKFVNRFYSINKL